jgi:hypothetical protein
VVGETELELYSIVLKFEKVGLLLLLEGGYEFPCIECMYLTSTEGWLFSAVWHVRVGEVSSECSVVYNFKARFSAVIPRR